VIETGILCAAALAVRASGLRLADVGLRFDDLFGDIWLGVKGYFWAAPWVFGLGILFNALARYLPGRENDVVGMAMNTDTVAAKALLVLSVAGTTPIVEELMFRGMLFPALWRRMGRFWPSAVIAGGFFMLLHAQFLQGVGVFALAIACALVYARTRRLVPCIVMHALNNGLIVTLMVLTF
jgi:membrane protease YdiL (CAAX protease family)